MRVKGALAACISMAWLQEHGTKASSEHHLQIPIIQRWRMEGTRSIRFLRSLITLYNVPTPIPTTQVTLNQHAGVLLFIKVSFIRWQEGKEEDGGGWMSWDRWMRRMMHG